jgi:hypothetical protein
MPASEIIFIVSVCVATCLVWAWKRSKEEDEEKVKSPEKTFPADPLQEKIKAELSRLDIMDEELCRIVYNIVNVEKSRSYKEGFWNGQAAKIEVVPMDEYKNFKPQNT